MATVRPRCVAACAGQACVGLNRLRSLRRWRRQHGHHHRCYAFARGQLRDADLLAATLATNINQPPCPSSLDVPPPDAVRGAWPSARASFLVLGLT